MNDPTAAALFTQLLREPWDTGLAGILADANYAEALDALEAHDEEYIAEAAE